MKGGDEMNLIGVNEVREILGVGESLAYKIMKQLNEELEKKGYLVIRGKIPREYLEERFYH